MVHNVDAIGSKPVGEVFRPLESSAKAVSADYTSRITSGEDEQSCCGSIFGKIGSAFSWVWESMKSVFQTIFFCSDYSGKVEEKKDNTELKALTELRDQFVELGRNFSSKRPEGQEKRAEFKKWWKEQFDALSPEVRKLITIEDLKSMVSDKTANVGKKPSEEQVLKDATAMYEIKEKREESEKFVRNLRIAKWDEDKSSLDPISDACIPQYLKAVVAILNQKISALDDANSKS